MTTTSTPQSSSRGGPAIFVTACATAILSQAAHAQLGRPTWWETVRENTVSVCHDFRPPNTLWPPTPSRLVAPSWFSLTPTTQWQRSSNWVWEPQVAGREGVWRAPGAANAFIQHDVDNDPQPNSVKEVYVTFTANIAPQDLLDYRLIEPPPLTAPSQLVKLRNTQRYAFDLPGGWKRYELKGLAAPCPDEERYLISTTSTDPNTDTVIDDIYEGTKCVKESLHGIGAQPQPLGVVVPIGNPQRTGIDVAALLPNGWNASAVARTEIETSPSSFETRYWVAAAAQGGPGGGGPSFALFELDPSQAPGNEAVASFPLPAIPNVQIGAQGIVDLTVDTSAADGQQPVLYGLLAQQLAGAPQWKILAFDVVTRSFAPSLDVTIGNPLSPNPQSPPPNPGGLAYFDDGDDGAGSFWVITRNGAALEYSRSGQLEDTIALGRSGLYGAGYDPTLGKLALFSRDAVSGDPRSVQVVGSFFDLSRRAPDGTEFYGDLSVQAPSPGGRAEAMHVYRHRSGRLRILCLADAAGQDTLYEISGPFQFGLSCTGAIGMQGVPFRGNPNWRVTLDGVQGASSAALMVGFDRSTFQGLPLPIELDPLGFSRCAILISFDADLGSSAVIGNGTEVNVAIPDQAALSYREIFLQWLVLDPTRPGGIGLSPGGATVIY